MSTHQRFEALSSHVTKTFCNPSILPIPRYQSGNNVSFSENKTKRRWYPNVNRFRWPVVLLGGLQGRNHEKPMRLMRMTTQVGKLKEYERAGGVEGMLVSHTSGEKDWSDSERLRRRHLRRIFRRLGRRCGRRFSTSCIG